MCKNILRNVQKKINGIIQKIEVKISLLTLAVFILLILIQHIFFGVAIDRQYFSNLFDGLVPNVLSIVFAIFLVDVLLKQKEQKDLEELNRLKSESVKTVLSLLVWHILKFFDEPIEDSIEKLDLAMMQFRKYDNDKIVNLFYKKFYSVKDHEKSFLEFKKLVEADVEAINKTLKELHPVANAEVSNFFGNEVYIFLESMSVMMKLLDIPEQETFKNERIASAGSEKFGENLTEFKETLSSFVLKSDAITEPLISFWNRLISMYDRAERNDLFFKS